MEDNKRQVSEIITVPSYRFPTRTELLAHGRRSHSDSSENDLINGTSPREEINLGRKSGRASSCGSDARVHKTFAHTSGTNDALQVNKKEIKNLIVDLLRSHLGSIRYDHKLCGQKCLKLSEIIETNVRKRCPGCKVVATLLIGALRDKGPAIASQSLYSQCSDCIALAYFSNHSLFASAAVFVVRL